LSNEERTFKVSMVRKEGFKFEVDFGLENGLTLMMDEPPPVGEYTGPNASKILAAAMGNCLTASLMFCLQKARANVGDIKTDVEGVMRRNEKGRWRIQEINIDIDIGVDDKYVSQYDRCYDLFEDFCIVSKSIEEGIPFNVQVNRK
jgi:uncharacterized OsmC-like protein